MFNSSVAILGDLRFCCLSGKFPPLCSDMSMAGRRMCTVMLQLKKDTVRAALFLFLFFFRVFKWYLLLLVGLDTQAWVFV